MRGLARALLLLLAAAPAAAQARAVVTDLGHGASGRILAAALAQSHRLVEPAPTRFVLDRGAQARNTLVILGRSASIRGNVEGDVIVVDGDLFVSPGARIAGRAIAIGGGVYPSALAVVERGTQSFRDNTFIISRTAQGYALAYQSLREHASEPLLFPALYGVRMPTYDRVNGLSVPFGPSFAFRDGDGLVDLLVTYRSDLGAVDPSLTMSMQLSRRLRVQAELSRGSVSNDAWIWSDFVNSLSVLAFGEDTRNWFRADRAEFRMHRLWETTNTRVEPFVGARVDRAWTVGPATGERRGPWSLLGRTDTLAMWRPNPAVLGGGLSSVLTGGTLQWERDELRLDARTTGEIALESPGGRHFAQLVSDIAVGFPTLGEHQYALDVHWMTTVGDTPPPERFASLGGSGTLPFLGMLEQGGDEVLLIDQRYSIPLLNVRVGILGNPTLLLRHRIGSAGLGGLPAFEQVLGVGVMLVFVRGELQVDAATGRFRFSTGFSFSR